MGRVVIAAVLVLSAARLASGAPPPEGDPNRGGPIPEVSFRPAAGEVDAYDFVEIAVAVAQPGKINPFTQASVRGRFRREGEEPVVVDGFCDAADGTLFKVRYLPSRPGRYQYTIDYHQ